MSQTKSNLFFMRQSLRLHIVIIGLFFTGSNFAQPASVQPPLPVFPIPSAAQMKWHKMEMNAFIHFSINTFTDKEWGYGNESAQLFNPSALNTEQWAKILKETGFKTMILTTKHHDGFCLWPSKYSDHTIKNSPYKNGKGDLVKEASASSKKYGLHFGVYLSPWDRNRADYGTASYITYYRNQLKELFTQYGPIVEMWFDGANGGDGYYGGANEKRKIDGATYYDWPNTIQLVKSLQPNVIFFSDAGPGVRWVGNELGFVNETNWNTISTDTLFAGKAGIETLLGTGSPDGNQWVPAEVDVSIRPGWFWHESENDQVKTPEQLFDIYLTSVGRGSTLLLNIPPDKRGLFHENDIAALRGFKKILDREFAVNKALNATATAAEIRGGLKAFSAKHLTDGREDTYWTTNDDITSADFTIDFEKPTSIQYIVLQEYIQLGQRVKSFIAEVWKDNTWQKVATGTTIGYKRILKINPVNTSKIRITIEDSKACPVISNVEVY